GMALTALAGPVSNVVLSFLACVLLRVASMTWLLYSGSMESWLYYLMMFFMYFTYINASLAVFNMLPVPPFDGSRIVLAFLPRRIYFGIMKYERYIFIAMFILLYIGVFDKPLSAASQWLVDGELSATKFINGLFGYYGDDIL
ncbi:MAG: site-2 protease family protein, partial [Oscillospiraceae bacterium]